MTTSPPTEPGVRPKRLMAGEIRLIRDQALGGEYHDNSSIEAMLGHIAALEQELALRPSPADREPPHCPSCNCGEPILGQPPEPCEHQWRQPDPPVTATNMFCGKCGFFPGPAVEPDVWQPIETAPKDGTRILTICDELGGGTTCVVVKWVGEFSGWSMPGQSGLRPSLWQPLPRLPETKAEK